MWTKSDMWRKAADVHNIFYEALNMAQLTHSFSMSLSSKLTYHFKHYFSILLLSLTWLQIFLNLLTY